MLTSKAAEVDVDRLRGVCLLCADERQSVSEKTLAAYLAHGELPEWESTVFGSSHTRSVERWGTGWLSIGSSFINM